ncbi:hypothetical protein DAY19_03330 [Halobacteriovorax vibrionivorans]|uniref:Uncharacterized protein n=1 Tax=Halobacteriovorax vibrionivorans TaxID=2152716 RepID=A0ABY0IKZ1_9BACT|nr:MULTISPECIES: hypothetical protein [Halobacteriovorax]RZF22818.1 hypothetical protein DAY19_03330 [Halobacteriovorax vibrionivorans]TGD47389.1 hypothetical protein EP118_08720 [Halobacteriovorax sp. Y22]
MDIEHILREKKIEFLYASQAKLKEEFNIDVPVGTGFGKSKSFYFIPVGNKKYVFKPALKYLVTEAPDIDRSVDFTFDELLEKYRKVMNKKTILPTLLEESESFLVFEYYREENGWFKMDDLKENDGKVIVELTKNLWGNDRRVLFPFYNQLYSKVYKNVETGEIKIVDLKYVEIQKRRPIFVYICDYNINCLYYLEKNRNPFFNVKNILAREYPIADAQEKYLYT